MAVLTARGFEDDFNGDEIKGHAEEGIRNLEEHLRQVAELPDQVRVLDVGRYAAGLELGLFRRRHLALPLSRLALQKDVPPIVKSDPMEGVPKSVEHDPLEGGSDPLPGITPDDNVG